MVEVRNRLGFALESSSPFDLREVCWKDLDRNGAAGARVCGLIDLAHAAFAEQVRDLVVRERLSDQLDTLRRNVAGEPTSFSRKTKELTEG